jgi:hypothetical protein
MIRLSTIALAAILKEKDMLCYRDRVNMYEDFVILTIRITDQLSSQTVSRHTSFEIK